MTRVRLLAALSIFAAAGCSLVLSYDGLVGGSSDAGAPEASAPDGSVDAPRDAPAAPDAADAGDARTDARVSPCARTPRPTLCDDFDTQPLNVAWDGVTLGGVGGSVQHHDAGALTLPNRLRIEGNAIDGGQSITASAEKTFATFANRPIQADITLAMRVDKLDSVANVLRFDLSDQPDDYSVRIRVASAQGLARIEIEEAGNPKDGGPRDYVQHGILRTAALGEWVDIRMELTLRGPADGGTGNRMRAYANGELKIDKPLVLSVPSGTPTMYLGITYVRSPSASWSIGFDDVALQLANLP
jgi:hypothetical protein